VTTTPAARGFRHGRGFDREAIGIDFRYGLARGRNCRHRCQRTRVAFHC
jgi:hypothetical protein